MKRSPSLSFFSSSSRTLLGVCMFGAMASHGSFIPLVGLNRGIGLVSSNTNTNDKNKKEATSFVCSTARREDENVARSSDTMDASTNIQFYTIKGGMCSFCSRTLIALRELDIPFDTVEIDPQQKPDWYRNIHPRGKFPALQNPMDGSIIYESSICNEYLSDLARSMDEDATTNRDKRVWKLMPTDPASRAKVRLLNHHYDSNVAPTQFAFAMSHRDATNDDEFKETLESSLQLFEDTLRENKGEYIMGEEFTLADGHAFPFVQKLLVTLNHFKGYEPPEDRFSRLLAWHDSCLTRDSIRPSTSKEEIIREYETFLGVQFSFLPTDTSD